MSTVHRDWKPGDRFEDALGELREVLEVRGRTVYYWADGRVQHAAARWLIYIPDEAHMEAVKAEARANGLANPRCTQYEEPAIKEFATRLHLRFSDL